MAVYDSTDPLKRGLVLEPVERGFLRTLLLEDKTVFDEDTVLRFSRDVACAMQFVHQRGYIHCYLGSPSVVLTENFTAKVRFLVAHLLRVKLSTLQIISDCICGPQISSPSYKTRRFVNMKGKKLARVTLFFFDGRVTLLAGPTLQHIRSISNLVLPAGLTRSRRENRDFKIQRRGRQRERQKKTIGLISKTTTLHVHHTFWYISFPFLHDYDVKMPNFAFYGGRKQATTKFYFSF